MNGADQAWEAFEGGQWGFGHRAHLRLAWAELRSRPMLAALPRFAHRLRALTIALGKPDKYHETLTGLWLLVVAEAMAGSHGEDFDAFVAAHPELLDAQGLPRRYYHPETLASARARTSFVLPDRLTGAASSDYHQGP